MSLTPGSRLGVYEVTSQIGAGGMGQVFRATDTKLKRQVAIKVLPPSLAADADSLARFQREAEVLASLNHPNIAIIHGLEESDGTIALVMELVEGKDLAQRIALDAIPIDEALAIARQIVDALEAAHEKGIVHRDLKPANIKVTLDGAVKVLDFGLAKMLQTEPAVSSMTMSPTLSVQGTFAGTILGTAAYMSPEQARGKPVDKRTDIWAFGCVLFEMLTGKQAFEAGETISDAVAAILTRDPDWTLLPPRTPTAIRRLLRRCLERDRARRLGDVHDARLDIDEALSPGDAESAGSATTRLAARPQILPWSVAGLAIAGLLLVFGMWAPWRPAAPTRVTRTTITTFGAAELSINDFDNDLALSADGTRLIYLGNNSTQIFVRSLDALEPVALASGQLRGPFISPDGQWVGFISGGSTLKKVAITGGPPITIASLEGNPRGATWGSDDTIILGSGTGLQRVSAAGGTPEVLSQPDHTRGEGSYLWPQILPGGRAVLFTITSQTGGLDMAQVAVRDLRTGMQRVLVRGGSDGRYVAGPASPKRGEIGHLVYVAAGTLRAVPFDLNRLETHGTAVPVLPRLAMGSGGSGDFALATNGTLVYVDAPGSAELDARTLAWVDRMGNEEPVGAPPRAYQYPRLSPDGTRVALSIADQENDIWIWDLRRATLTRLTVDPSFDWHPVWTSDGRRIVFSSNRGGSFNLWWQASDGTSAAERLTKSSNPQYPTGLTPDGAAVVFFEQAPTTNRDLLLLSLDGTRHVTPLLQTKFDERNGIVSPNGRWLAYESNSSGVLEIYVRPFPNTTGGQWQVSTSGGTKPLWAPNGKELFWVGVDGALLRAPVEAGGTTWNAGTPIKLLERRYYMGAGGTSSRTYDVSRDGQRFLMIKALGTDAGAGAPALIVVQHWDEELKRLAPIR